jgi:peptidoglycan DL-endopeptidase CwlO
MIPYRLFFILIISIFLVSQSVSAQSVDELRSKINERTEAIKQLETEIAQYQKDIATLGKEKDSLSNTIKSLDISKKKLEADIKITENKIASRNLEIKQLSLQIGDKSERIEEGKRVISHSLYTISQMDSSTLLANLLSKESLSDFWNAETQLSTLQGDMQERIRELENLKVNLEANKKLTERKKAELIELTNDLKSQTKAIADTTKEKNVLLAETKNSEAAYKTLLATKQAQKAQFEKELFQYESALKIAIDPSLIPAAGKGVLSWPLRNIVITQYFGKTVDAKRLYTSGTHGGVDFSASIGTPVMAALGGIVTDTEAVKYRSGCQYGKFVLIKHPNGLSTIYGHLSTVDVNPGDVVTTGEKIGNSGNTGYATGPHLHFGVYATQGIRVVDASNLGSINCAGIKTVAADPKAYLDPLLYL